MRLHSLRRKTKGKSEMEGVLELYIKTRRLYSMEQLPSSAPICLVCHLNTPWLLNPTATMDGKPERFSSLTHTGSRDKLWKLPSERNLLSVRALKNTSALWTLTYWKDILFEDQTFNLKHSVSLEDRPFDTDYCSKSGVSKIFLKEINTFFQQVCIKLIKRHLQCYKSLLFQIKAVILNFY